MKPLFIIITKKYFNEIKEGRKTEEFRLQTDYWRRRLSIPANQILFKAGYRKGSSQMIIEYNGYIEKIIQHEHFGNDPVNVFALQLGKILTIKT